MRLGIRLAVLLAAMLCLALPGSASPASGTVTLTNFTATGDQVARVDVNGNALDAHDGQIAQFGNTYYLYGTSYTCGYEYLINANFCGFKVYSSTDLTHWTDRGYVALPRSCQYCFRPHVLYNHQTHKYVLWVNDGAAPQGYLVYTNDSPTGVFTEQNIPALAVSCGVDFTLFEDTDGTAYIAHNDACHGVDMVVEQLTGDYLSTDGSYTRLGLSAVEAPAMFRRGNTYYITMSDPNCAYCTGTGTGYMTASSPLGPWTGASGVAQPWTVSNGQLHVDGGGLGTTTQGASWTDYTFASDVAPQQTGSLNGGSYAQAGLAFRVDSNGDGYAFLLSNYAYSSANAGGYLAFVKLTGGSAALVSSAALPFAVTGGQTYHVAIGVQGNTFTATVNGTLADTVTDASYSAGAVGLLENQGDNESTTVDNVDVTGPSGQSLFADDFSSGTLTGWQPPTRNTAILISPDSCGGQPSFVAPLQGAKGSTVYLYGSDLWNAHRNEGESNFYWAPLQFATNGAIQPIACTATATVALADDIPGHQNTLPGQDQSSGVAGFTDSCLINGGAQATQSFTAGRSGTLRQVQVAAYQETTPAKRSGQLPADEGPSPNAPLSVSLVSLDGQGTLATQVFDPNIVGWAPDELTMTPNVPVVAGHHYEIVLSSASTQGCYGALTKNGNLMFATAVR
ncbi:MAG TPA: family 43 glycosylhydrolase [Pseudonocardiaceae bacterium]